MFNCLKKETTCSIQLLYEAPLAFTRYTFLLLVIGYFIFIGLASFYLTNTIPSSDSAVKTLLQTASIGRLNFHNLRDISTNILLYMPLGFLIAMYRASLNRLELISPLIVVGFLVSIFVEVTQAFIGRTSDLMDIISNGSGHILGYLVAWIAVKQFHLEPDIILGLNQESETRTEQTLSAIRFVYLAITTITSLLPFNVTVSLSELYSKTTDMADGIPRLIIDPFYHINNGQFDVQYISLHALIYVPLAFLSSIIFIQRRESNLFGPALHCLLFGLSIEFMQLFIKSGRSDIAIPLLALFIGFVVSWTITKLIPINSGLNQAKGHAKTTFQPKSATVTALIVYMVFLLIFMLSPYEFELTINAIKHKFHDSNFIPLRAHFSARSIAAAIDLVREPLLYAPLGVLLFSLIKEHYSKWKGMIIAIVVTGATSGMIEIIQLSIVGRFVDITDPMLAVGGAIAGLQLAHLFQRNQITDDGSV